MLPKPENAVVVKSGGFEPYLEKSFGEFVLVFPGVSYGELHAISIERRRQLYAEAVAARERRLAQRLPAEAVVEVFSDLEFDPETGEVFS